MYIRPTIGRMVWYRPLEWEENAANTPPRFGDPSDGFMSAQVCSVEHPGGASGPSPDYAVVNLSVLDRGGQQLSRTSVTLRHDVDTSLGDVCPPGCAVWMPYQQGQAAKTEQVEQTVGGRESAEAQAGSEPETGGPQGGSAEDSPPVA